jgi:hypothetical protein
MCWEQIEPSWEHRLVCNGAVLRLTRSARASLVGMNSRKPEIPFHHFLAVLQASNFLLLSPVRFRFSTVTVFPFPPGRPQVSGLSTYSQTRILYRDGLDCHLKYQVRGQTSMNPTFGLKALKASHMLQYTLYMDNYKQGYGQLCHDLLRINILESVRILDQCSTLSRLDMIRSLYIHQTCKTKPYIKQPLCSFNQTTVAKTAPHAFSSSTPYPTFKKVIETSNANRAAQSYPSSQTDTHNVNNPKPYLPIQCLTVHLTPPPHQQKLYLKHPLQQSVRQFPVTQQQEQQQKQKETTLARFELTLPKEQDF